MTHRPIRTAAPTPRTRRSPLLCAAFLACGLGTEAPWPPACPCGLTSVGRACAAPPAAPVVTDFAPPAGTPGHWEIPRGIRLAPTPPPPEALVGAGPVVYAGFTSVQVNVDAAGQNIPGDAANEPSITVDPNQPNRMAIGWRHFNTVASDHRESGVAYSQDGGLTWVYNGNLTPGVFGSDPVLGSTSDGTFHYVSIRLR